MSTPASDSKDKATFTTGFCSGSVLEHFVPKQGPQAPGTMWVIYGLVACASPVGLLLARRWLVDGVPASAEAAGAEK